VKLLAPGRGREHTTAGRVSLRTAVSVPQRTFGVLALLALLVAMTGGCAHVAPYERGKLAHPMMTADDLEGAAASHVEAVHEGATGGGAVGGGGCGCN
jgi:hypothetical protein